MPGLRSISVLAAPSHLRTLSPSHLRTLALRVLGVFGAEAPKRAARAVGHDTTVPNRAGPPPRQGFRRIRGGGARAAASRPSGRASLTHRRAPVSASRVAE